MRRAWPGLVLVAAVGLAAGCVGAVTDSPAPVDQGVSGTWEQLLPLPAPRQEVAVAALDGRVYVVGGFDEAAEPTAAVEAYDPVSREWTARAPLPVAVHHAAAAVLDGRLFVAGGFSGGRVRWTVESALWEYDPAADRWTRRADMPTPRGALGLAALDGRLHALGGSADRPTNAHEVYDPRIDTWRAANAMPTARDHLAVVAYQGRVWALGGRSSFVGTQYANVEIYDPASDAWRTGVPLPVGRGGLAAAVLGDRIFVFGGEAPFRIFSAVEMWEPAGQRWIARPPLPTPRHGLGAAVVGGRIYVVAGGREPGYNPTTANEAFTP
jgi:N-acetylneuraminic acid mutarotase